ncbi:putative pentatricopeptide repeat-containing protein At3g13770, mitochondrial [Sesamum indicum]|uniref:Pentatricopeptide repeat-containing protein At3g13770, mitochondrial n=1 Tax=Sesamum indicum TaxID=4182 RepID=A0A6I9T4R6_SESIN|nr:putative pentatricopeptide repeat-containing protein At3g13770, mitochondrial [Sesamum indicum]
MLRRIPQFSHHLIYLQTNRPFTTLQLTFNSFPPNSSDSNTPRCNVHLHHALQEMCVQGLNMKFKHYDAVLNECVNHKSLRGGQRVQAHMMKTHYLPPVYLRTRLIVLYVKCEVLSDARMVFDEMPVRNVVSWTAMISGYTKSGLYSEALSLFVEMLRSGTCPNEFTFATVLTSCMGAFGFEYGRQIHSLIVKSPFELHMYVGSSLLDLYAKSGRIHEARIIFEGLPERDVVSCTAIISGYAQLGHDREALDLFCTLQREGMASNYVTYACVVTALSGLAAFEYGRQVHGHVLRSELSFCTVLQNSLIDMYSKCGNLNYARSIFDKMQERTVISWNAMLAGYSKHGMGKAVVDLYNMMREENKISPDSTTLLAVLSGCSHGGMENKGLKYFDEMAGKYATKLGIEHYGCVIDLLGRAGQLERALQFIEEIPFKPNAAIWGSLLGACRVHQNIGVGKIAGNRLLELEPENAGNYVILCNLYASNGKWDEVRKVRELMKEQAVMKEPGKSWIEFGRTLHTFYASDRSHPRKEEVLSKVRQLSDRIKEVGYKPELSSVLYDVDEEQKEKMLLGHSEKLALAFAMMNVSEAKPIRIMKNLRICVDCHNFARFVSQVYVREILIRDKSRFHHIVNGVCSCGDYW